MGMDKAQFENPWTLMDNASTPDVNISATAHDAH